MLLVCQRRTVGLQGKGNVLNCEIFGDFYRLYCWQCIPVVKTTGLVGLIHQLNTKEWYIGVSLLYSAMCAHPKYHYSR